MLLESKSMREKVEVVDITKSLKRAIKTMKPMLKVLLLLEKKARLRIITKIEVVEVEAVVDSKETIKSNTIILIEALKVKVSFSFQQTIIVAETGDQPTHTDYKKPERGGKKYNDRGAEGGSSQHYQRKDDHNEKHEPK